MTSKWDRSSKDDFNKAAENSPPEKEEQAKAEKPAEHNAIGDGPKPPGGRGPSTNAYDRHIESKDKRPETKKDDPNLSKNFNNRSRG